MRFVLSCLAATACALSAQARAPVGVSYTCDVRGDAGELRLEYEAFDPAGIEVYTPFEDITAEIDAGTTIYFYSGTFAVSDKSFVLTGEDRTAEFTDLETLERFFTSMKLEDGRLRVVRLPLDEANEPFFCTLDEVDGQDVTPGLINFSNPG